MANLPTVRVVCTPEGPGLTCSACGPISVRDPATATVARLRFAERSHYTRSHRGEAPPAAVSPLDHLRSLILLLGDLHAQALRAVDEGEWQRSQDAVEQAVFHSTHNSMGLLAAALQAVNELQAQAKASAKS